jgi:hypothetical protein
MDNEKSPSPLNLENPSDEPEGSYWTPRHILYILIILITLIAFLIYVLSPTITAMINPPPPPTIDAPLQRV